MAVDDLTRRTFVKGSAAVGGGIALGGPISALGADAAHGKVKRVVGYGELQPTPEQDTGEVYLDLPRGFRYRVISRDYEIMSDGNPTPGIFDGTGAYPGPRNTTVLIRNHENRSRPNEITVDVPVGRRYDPDVNVRGGNTKLVVDRNRRVVESFAVLGGTHTNCAGGVTPWNSWITCEEIFNYGAVENNVTPGTGVPHGYAFEVPSEATGPVSPVPITAAGRFAREAVAFLDGILYQTEDRGDAAFYRFVPDRTPREWGDLATFGGTLQALKVRNRPNFDMDSANPGESYPVEWVTIEEPNPLTDTVRVQAQALGAALFTRTEGIWAVDRRVLLRLHVRRRGGRRPALAADPARQGPWRPEADLRVARRRRARRARQPRRRCPRPATCGCRRTAAASSSSAASRGAARSTTSPGPSLNGTEFCGGCFSPDGRTFFVSQQGERVADESSASETTRALTYAIWGPFEATK